MNKLAVTKTRINQKGIVSILVCMIMVIVITLVVLGFSQLSRSEDQQALNRQLSAEALYAAYSGINNTISIINNDVAQGQAIPQQQHNCSGDDSNGAEVYNQTSDLANDSSTPVMYTCVNVNTHPTTVEKSIAQGSSFAFPVLVSSGDTSKPITDIDLSWTGTGSSTSGCPPAGSFPAGGSFPASCAPTPLQIDLIAAQASQTQASAQADAYTIFASPESGSPQSGTLTQGAASVFEAPCTTTGCTLTITLPAPQDSEYYARVTALYGDVNLTAEANGGEPLYDIEADIDVTGKAQDVLQRLDARIPLDNLGGVPFAVQTGDSICAQLEGYPGYVTSPADPNCSN